MTNPYLLETVVLIGLAFGLYALWQLLSLLRAPGVRFRARKLWLRGPGRKRYQAATMFIALAAALEDLHAEIYLQQRRGMAGRLMMADWLEQIDQVVGNARQAAELQNPGPHLYPGVDALRRELDGILD